MRLHWKCVLVFKVLVVWAWTAKYVNVIVGVFHIEVTKFQLTAKAADMEKHCFHVTLVQLVQWTKQAKKMSNIN